MKVYKSNIDVRIMEYFPSKTAAATFPDWVANHAGLEQCIGVMGLLDPPFYEIRDMVFWNLHVADKLRSIEPTTPHGNDSETVEKYFNLFNVSEFFLMAATEAVDIEELVQSFGQSLKYFWAMALQKRLPEKSFEIELSDNLFDEEGLCLTFWQAT